jgi:hypothetical protein
MEPQLGVDAAGDAVLGWQDGKASYRPAGGDWQPLTRPLDASDTELAVARDGSMVFAGRHYDGPVYVVTGDHGKWSGAVTLGSSTAYVAPSAAIAPGGIAVVAWSRAEHGNNIVYSAVRRGGAWETATALSFVDGDAYDPAVAIDAAGNALAIWDATVDPESSFRPAGSSTWQRPVVAGPPIAYPSPTLAMNAAGDAVAVWVGLTTSPTGATSDLPVGGAYFTADGWQAAQTFGSEGSHFDQNAAVGIDARGDAIAVWSHFDGFDANRNAVATLQSAILDNGGPLPHACATTCRPVSMAARASAASSCARAASGPALRRFGFGFAGCAPRESWVRGIRTASSRRTPVARSAAE